MGEFREKRRNHTRMRLCFDLRGGISRGGSRLESKRGGKMKIKKNLFGKGMKQRYRVIEGRTVVIGAKAGKTNRGMDFALCVVVLSGFSLDAGV